MNLDNNPQFNKNLANLPYNEVVDGGSMFGYTNLRVVHKGFITHIQENGLGSFETVVTIRHELGKKYDIIARVKPGNEDFWYTIPTTFEMGGDISEQRYIQVQEITETEVIFYCFNANLSGPCEFQVVFLEFYMD